MSSTDRISEEAKITLNIIGLCDKYSTLPNDGGLLAQDKLFIYVLEHAAMWQHQRAELDNNKKAQGKVK